MKKAYLAADFGGGSGRVMAGYITDGKLKLEEIHRFGNRQIRIGKHLYWDFPALFEDMKEGIRKAARREDLDIKSIGIDTWGVDFGFVDAKGNLLGLPVCYRDERTNGLCEDFVSKHDAHAHYAVAGIQMMDINTIYQLIAMQRDGSPLLSVADYLMFMPDLFSYFLTGKPGCEYTIASTSELLNAQTRDWNFDLIESLGLRSEMFPPIIMPGEIRGTLTPSVAHELGLSTDVRVVAVGSHDTQSASFASHYKSHASQTTNEGLTAFLSSGTWSLLGVALNEPVLSEEARLSRCSNEGGILLGKDKEDIKTESGFNFLQNITGLWFLQRLMAEWSKRGEDVAFDVILPAAEASDIKTILDVDDPVFANPRDMETAIIDYCNQRNLQPPTTIGETVRVVLQSLAARYARGIEDFNKLLPSPISAINIIGGGSRNALLNRLTEEATGLPVISGPVEATGIGNVLVQIISDGEVKPGSTIVIE